MHVFLQFLFDSENIKKNIRDEWIKLYDYTYIDEKIIGGIEKNLPNVAEVLASVEKKATGKTVSSLTQSSLGQEASAIQEGNDSMVIS
jgi:ferritin-like protein